MVNSNRKTSNDILVKVDQNNLMYIDPNSIITDGNITERTVQQENLMMYVNLEADLIPRTTLIADNDKSTLKSIAKGTLNFMSSNGGKDYDTTWTDAYTDFTASKDGSFYQTDATGQSFGISEISMKTAGYNAPPSVTIRFIDVRGKTLFDSPENSPYQAFFHIPWPIFYLTIKGYYGKAIRYRLHLIKFNTRFNGSNGNFEVDTTFVGSTYAFMNDIPFDGILDAPYMFQVESDEPATYNESTGLYTKKLKKSTKGYQILKSVYNEYKQKKLLPKNFPVKTLREIIVIARRLNKILEQQIFSKVVSPKILAGVKEFEDDLTNLESAITGWRGKNLSAEYYTDQPNVDTKWYILSSKEKSTLEPITGKSPGNLALIIENLTKKLDNNAAFGKNGDKKELKKYKVDIHPITMDKLSNLAFYYKIAQSKVGFDMEGYLNVLYGIQKDFAEQRDKLQKKVEIEMNNIVKDGKLGIGFEPTLRNIVGVILANADTYVRLMKDVHVRAFDVANRRKDILNGVSTDSIGEDVYPWPQVKKPTDGRNQNVVVYPGAREMVGKLRSDDKTLWPEVDFVENFFAIATKKIDPLSEKDGDENNTTFIFETDTDILSKKDISTLTYLTETVPYSNKSITSILYEIWERAKYVTMVDSFNNEVIKEFALIEFENIKNQIEEDFDIIEILKTQVKTVQDLQTYLRGYSPYERYPYYKDQIPTVGYIKNVLEKDFDVSLYTIKNTSVNFDSSYPALKNNLYNYTSEKYRTNVYPFNSSTYLSYIRKDKFDDYETKSHSLLEVDTNNAFIVGPINPSIWVRGYKDDIFKGLVADSPDYITNMFTKTIKIDGQNKHMLNTPYFHKTLYNDFATSKVKGKYAASSYLMLMSLPFKDLDERTMYYRNNAHKHNPTRLSTLFREVNASHFVPYHLMLKWGAMYHRYKTYLMDGIDILSGVTTSINMSTFFDNGLNRQYPFQTEDGTSFVINNTERKNVGLTPFYHSIFHQVVNDYTFYNQPATTGTTSYQNSVSNNVTKIFPVDVYGGKVWTSFIDNSKFNSNIKKYTLLPSNGYSYLDISDTTYAEQENFRLLWDIGVSYLGPTDTPSINYSGQTFPTYEHYFKDIDNQLVISNNNKKVFDLIATFKSDILDTFEEAFLEFSSEQLNEEQPYKMYDVKYYSFQSMLKDMVYLDKEDEDPTDSREIVRLLKTRQRQRLEDMTQNILSYQNLVKITLSNTRELNGSVLGGYTMVDVDNFYHQPYVSTQATPDMLDAIKLYLGEDMDGYYLEFFAASDIELTINNIQKFRFVIYLYAGWRKSGNASNRTNFVEYLKDNILLKGKELNSSIEGQTNRLTLFLNTLFTKIPTLTVKNTQPLTINRGFNDDVLKLELYSTLKSFNDKWVAGNSLGQRTLMEEFLFLDRANRDIGDKVYIAMDKLIDIMEQKNQKRLNLSSLLVVLLNNTGIDIRALPAYVNWYGTNFNSKTKLTPSKKVASDIFGTFLEVDYQESTPKIILQYKGPNSKHLEISDINKKMYKYKNDSFDVSNQVNNPLLVTPEIYQETDFTKSNKLVAFEVSFGDQAQSIFKGIQLDQSSIKNTSESYKVYDQLGNSESGSSTAQLDIGLWDIYRQASYTCDVTMMGNAMIQPTMYFYLKNVPLFRGTYWITEVNHTIRTTGMETTFKGSRVPIDALPDPRDSFMASYRALFDKVTNQAVAKVKEAVVTSGATINNEKTISDASGVVYSYNMGAKSIPGESIIQKGGIKSYGMPYNGYNEEKYVQMVNYNGEEWLRAYVVEMGGSKYTIDDTIAMNIISKYQQTDKKNTVIKWGDIKDDKTNMFYASKFSLGGASPNTIIDRYTTTEFLNPDPKKSKKVFKLTSSYNFTDKKFSGPINVGPKIDGYGIGMSKQLMKELDLFDGDIVYFRLK